MNSKSQRIVLIIVFGKIQGLRLLRNSFAGVIAESHTSILRLAKPFFEAENLTIIQYCAFFTVSAAPRNLFPKQHNLSSKLLIDVLYNRYFLFSSAFFNQRQQRKKQRKRQNCFMRDAETQHQADRYLNHFSEAVAAQR